MEHHFLTRLAIALCLTLFPTLSPADLKRNSSSDIMAEISFLESILPGPPPGVSQIGNSEELAFLNYLSSYAICEGWDFEQYIEFVETYEQELQSRTPVDRTLMIRLLKRSYEIRAEDGCVIDERAKRVVESFYGEVGTYFLALKRRAPVVEAIAARHAEMLRRTLGIRE